MVQALPTIARIQHKSLQLFGYTLNSGICHALLEYFTHFKNAITKISLDNNGLKEDMTSFILEGLYQQDEFKSIIISRNSLDDKCAEILRSLLKRGFPKNLEELRLINCKIQLRSVEVVLRSIRETPNLRKLGLVKIPLNDACMRLLSEIL